MKLRFDHHTHTDYSHGHGSPEDIVRAAIQKGLSSVAITEHAPAHLMYGVRGEKLAGLRRETDRLASVYSADIDVLFGMECNLTGFGECDLPGDPAMFDVLLLAYHRGVWPRDPLALSCAAEALGLSRADPVRVSEALLAAAEKYRIGIFSHPSLYVKCDISTLARGAQQLGVLIELNGARLTLTDSEILAASKAGAKFIINSDAHSPERVGDGGESLAAAERLSINAVNAER